MSDRRLAPPGGWPAPPDFRAEAEEVARRHFAQHPEELERYGEHAMDWCVHDNQHILAWAAGDAEGSTDLEKEIHWLAGLLGARGYPLSSLADDLETAAGVVPKFGDRLRAVAAVVRALP